MVREALVLSREHRSNEWRSEAYHDCNLVVVVGRRTKSKGLAQLCVGASTSARSALQVTTSRLADFEPVNIIDDLWSDDIVV